MDYRDKLKGQDGRRSVYDILSLNPNNAEDWAVINDNYRAIDIDKVVIGGNTFTNYGDLQFIWEKSYVKSPVRSANGTIDNLNSYATFVTPHLIMNFAVMSIDDFRKIVRMDLERNEFIVECYDPIYNKPMTAKMYFSTLEMAKLIKISRMRFNGDEWEDFVELVGVNEYSVELVGTNADLDLLSVRYFVNAPANMTPSVTDGGENDVYSGQEIIIGGNTNIPTETFASRKKFKNWNTQADGTGVAYINGYAYTIIDSIALYAQWEDMSEYTLTYNYGIADPAINNEEMSYITSKKVKYGSSIGTLPTVQLPTVEATRDGVKGKYTPYYNPKWYKIPTKTGNANDMLVQSNDLFWANRDTTIYLLFDKYTYPLRYYINGVLYMRNANVEYASTLVYPSLVKQENGKTYVSDGWYTTPDFKDGSKYSGNMPPFELNLYARWVESK